MMVLSITLGVAFGLILAGLIGTIMLLNPFVQKLLYKYIMKYFETLTKTITESEEAH